MWCERKLSCPLVPTYSNKSITDARSICEQNHSVVTTDNLRRAHPCRVALPAHPGTPSVSDDLLSPQRGQHGIRIEP